MKLFGVDTSLKWIDFELDGTHYSIHFKDSFLRGVHEVSVWKGKGAGYSSTTAKIESTYPKYLTRLKEIRIRLPIWWSVKGLRR